MEKREGRKERMREGGRRAGKEDGEEGWREDEGGSTCRCDGWPAAVAGLV